MPVLLVIPARYASGRFPGKALAELRGATGKTRCLIQRTWEAAQQVKSADRIVVATDDTRIKNAAESFEAEVIMTSSSCRNGTERCAEVIGHFKGFDVVVNLQGDAPTGTRVNWNIGRGWNNCVSWRTTSPSNA